MTWPTAIGAIWSNIRGDALSPAFVDMAMQQTAIATFAEARGEGGAHHHHPPGGIAASEAMSSMVVFLLSDDTSMVTGTTQIAYGGTIVTLR